ncbi:MAG: hypothetical protein JOY81_01765 [Alphaproteobacteria bacterium]|nr:hypothetical protein [Alphaproteobacteria bacterium]
MPIQLEIIPLDRLIVGVGRGQVTLQEYQDFLVQVMQSKVMHYRKLIDITLAERAELNREQVLAIEGRLASFADKFPRGALAIVIEPSRVDNAQLFKALAAKDRPVEIFTNVHAAKKWLRDQPVIDPTAKP